MALRSQAPNMGRMTSPRLAMMAISMSVLPDLPPKQVALGTCGLRQPVRNRSSRQLELHRHPAIFG